MKRTPMRRTWMRRRTGTDRSAYAQRERDVELMLFVKTLPCCAAYLGDCDGLVEADHGGRRGLSHKAADDTCIPLCMLHHRQRTDWTGPFKHWDRERMRVFLDCAIVATQAIAELVRLRSGPFAA